MEGYRRFRVLVLVDDYTDDHTKECLVLVVDTSLSARRVVRELDAVSERRGEPHTVVSDNSTGFTCVAILPAKIVPAALFLVFAFDLFRHIPEQLYLLEHGPDKEIGRNLLCNLGAHPGGGLP